MATRDRTGLFLRYREDARSLHSRQPTSTASKPGHDADPHDVEGDQLTRGGMEPEWVFAYNDLKGDIAELDKMLEQLAALYARHLLPSFGEKDTSQLEHDIRVRSHRLTELLQTVEQKVRNIYTDLPAPDSQGDADGGGGSSSGVNGNGVKKRDVERIIRRNLQKRFATPLQELSMNFRKRQKAYLDKLKDMRDSYGDDDRATNFGAPSQQPGQQDDDTFDPAFSEEQMLAVEDASLAAQERRRELERVTGNINDLATLVKDLAALVVDQGTVLDRVDYNIEEVKETTMAATRELRIAERYQRKQHAVCVIIVLAIACGVMAIILVHKWTS